MLSYSSVHISQGSEDEIRGQDTYIYTPSHLPLLQVTGSEEQS